MRLIVVVLTLLASSLRRQCGSAQAAKNTEFTFYKNSVKLPGPSMFFDVCLGQGMFEFQFKTFVEQALVLYQDDKGKSDYIEVSLQGGQIYFAFFIHNRGRKPNRPDWFRSEKRYNDFKWHKVTINRSPSTTSFSVDNESKTFHRDGRSAFASHLQIGGFTLQRLDNVNAISKQSAWKLYVKPSSAWDKRGFFNACVKNIKYRQDKDSSLETIHDIEGVRSSVKEGCGLTYCDKPQPVCKNQGICSTINEKIHSNDVECDCRWTGYEGANCTVGSLEFTLNGSYQVTYEREKFISLKLDNYKFRIKTMEENAIILHTKVLQGAKDKLRIEISDSMLKITSNLGAGDVVLETKRPISDNQWHLIEYDRNDEKMSLIMDGERKTASADREFKAMDYGHFVYLGEDHHPHENIKLQDFIWRFDDKDVNFVSGLYGALNGSSKENFTVTPKHILPKFNREIHWRFMPSESRTSPPAVDNTKCVPREGYSCATTGTPPTTVSSSETEARESSDESSVTWIVVVTVICALILFAIIAVLVHKWNKRYSGDFQVNRKEIGPSATVVHYKDSCYKEKQYQAKI